MHDIETAFGLEQLAGQGRGPWRRRRTTPDWSGSSTSNNLVPSGQTPSDGRPIFSTARVTPTFNRITCSSRSASRRYNAFTATLTKRMTHGWMTQATYTLARGVDNAPLTGTYVVGSGDDRVSDPSNLDRDKGVTPFNQTHTFAVSSVLAPSVSGSGLARHLLNNNQLGVILQANSGLPFNIRSNLDLNQDGVNNDRPLDIERNAGRLGRVVLPGSALLALHPVPRHAEGELFFEAKNLFNTENIAGVNRVVTTNALGMPATPAGVRRGGLSERRQESATISARCSSDSSSRSRCSTGPTRRHGPRFAERALPRRPAPASLACAIVVRMLLSFFPTQLPLPRGRASTPVGELPDDVALAAHARGSWRSTGTFMETTRIPTTRTTRCSRC